MLSALALALAVAPGSPDWGALRGLRGEEVAAPRAPGVVVVVTARRARHLRGWEEELLRLRPRPPVLRVVDLPPGARTEEVLRRLRRRVPPEVSIAVDGDRTVATALQLDTAEPNVLILDRTGRVRVQVRARAGSAAAAAVRRAWRAVASGKAAQP